jgi:hypothetical protein
VWQATLLHEVPQLLTNEQRIPLGSLPEHLSEIQSGSARGHRRLEPALEQFANGTDRQPLERQHLEGSVASQRSQCFSKWAVTPICVTVRSDDKESRASDVREHEFEQQGGRSVSPMQVVQNQQQRLRPGHILKRDRHGMEQPKARFGRLQCR